eukprot:gene15908-22042_t
MAAVTLERLQQGSVEYRVNLHPGCQFEFARHSSLQPGQELQAPNCIYSEDNVYSGCMQYDGNFVLYWNGNYAYWSTLTNDQGDSPHKLVMQDDGNLVLYANGISTWESGTSGNDGADLWLQKDGNLVIYKGDEGVWGSNVYGSATMPP